MRSLTAGELALMLAPARAYHKRVSTQNADGTWVELTNLGGVDRVLPGGKLKRVLDSPVWQAEFRIARDMGPDGTLSLAPLMTGSSLNVDGSSLYAPLLDIRRGFRVETAITLPGAAPVAGDWKRVFDGTIDDVKAGGNRTNIGIFARGLGAELQDTKIELREIYSDDAGVAVESVMQDIIDRWMAVPPTLVVPDPSLWFIREYTQDYASVMDAIQALALQRGWTVAYEWVNDTDMELRFYEPLRTKVVPDITIGPDKYFELRTLDVSLSDVVTVVGVRFQNSATGLPDYREAIAPTIGLYGRRYMEIEEGSSSNIDTPAEAQAMADAGAADLGTPEALHEIRTDYLWPLELGDLVRHEANGVHYDSDHDFAVVEIVHEFPKPGVIRTMCRTRGKPAGAYRRWLLAGGNAELPEISSGVPVPTFGPIVGEGSADGGQPYGMAHIPIVWGRNVDEVHIYAARGAAANVPNPPLDNRHLSAVLSRPEGATPQAEGWAMMHSIRTETNDFRKVLAFALNRDTGQQSVHYNAEIQAVDVGTGPAAAPSGLTVTVNGTTNEVRWTNNDAAAEALVYRNGICIWIEAAGGPGSFDDEELDTSIDYAYDVVAFRNGQTSAAVTTAPQTGGGSGTSSAPAWDVGYPQSVTNPLLPPGVLLDWTGDALYLASVDVEVAPAQRFVWTWSTLLAAQAVNPGAAILDATYPRGTDVYLRLKGNPINPADPVLYSEARYARYGVSSLP